MIIFGHTLQLKRIRSEKHNLNLHAKDLKIWFHKKGYPDDIIKEQVEKALRLAPNDENSKWCTIRSDI